MTQAHSYGVVLFTVRVGSGPCGTSTLEPHQIVATVQRRARLPGTAQSARNELATRHRAPTRSGDSGRFRRDRPGEPSPPPPRDELGLLSRDHLAVGQGLGHVTIGDSAASSGTTVRRSYGGADVRTRQRR